MQQSRKLATERPAQTPLPDIPEGTQPRRSQSEPRTDTEPLANALQLNVQGTESPSDSPMPLTGDVELSSFQSPATSSTPHGRGRSLIRPKPAWKVGDTSYDVAAKAIEADDTEAQVPTPRLSGTLLEAGSGTPNAPPVGSLSPVVPFQAPRQTRSRSTQGQRPTPASSAMSRTASTSVTAAEKADLVTSTGSPSFLLGRAGQLLAQAGGSQLTGTCLHPLGVDWEQRCSHGGLASPSTSASVIPPGSTSAILPRSSAPVRKQSKRRGEESVGDREAKKSRSGSRNKR
jgi:hypothetical protein